MYGFGLVTSGRHFAHFQAESELDAHENRRVPPETVVNPSEDSGEFMRIFWTIRPKFRRIPPDIPTPFKK